MAISDLGNWLDIFSGPDWLICAKRLSGNDTLANGTHQFGPYIPKSFLFSVLPALNRVDIKNPDLTFDLCVDSHADFRHVRAIYYNNKFHENPASGRNETRLTQFGGRASALLHPDQTGALAVFSFRNPMSGIGPECHVWGARDPVEEELIEERIGTVDPGDFVYWPAASAGNAVQQLALAMRAGCWLDADEMPAAWKTSFPTGADIVRKSVAMKPCRGATPDARLLARRDCEFDIFKSVEHGVEMPTILAGFATLDDFLARAQTILQRRKARSGRSLELQAREIFLEEHLVEGLQFSHQPESERGKRPDFLFPSQIAYRDMSVPAERLRMLAVKTTCKDRWRQVINEADRIGQKHLLTLQEGVSEPQFQEMLEAGVRLVVPSGNIKSFPDAVQPQLQTLESFILEVRSL